MNFIRTNWKVLGLALLFAGSLAYGVLLNIRIRALDRAVLEARQALQTAAAKREGYQPVSPVSQAKIEAALSPQARAELAEIRKAVKDTAVAMHTLTEANIAGTAPGKLTPATETAPPFCEDVWNRFKVNTADCSFTIRQKFLWEGRLLRGVDGKTRLYKDSLIELDPVTGLPIPGPAPELRSEIQVSDETAPEKVFGLKVLGGVDERLAPGLGLQAAEKWRLSLRAMGFYAPKDQDLRGQLGLGYRPKIPWFDSQVSIGGGIGLSTKKSGLIYGAHLTVPIGSITK